MKKLLFLVIFNSVLFFSYSCLGLGVQSLERQSPKKIAEDLVIMRQLETTTQVLNRIREKVRVQVFLEEETEDLEDREVEVIKNQNQVRSAVHSLLEMEEVVGGIGPQVSEIAKEFNNSVEATQKTELKISNRNSFVRFFMGGDKDAAKDLKQQIQENRERIQELRKLGEDCDCGEEVRNMFQEQIQSMEQEQERLDDIVAKENQSKGLFGWLFGWFFNWL